MSAPARRASFPTLAFFRHAPGQPQCGVRVADILPHMTLRQLRVALGATLLTIGCGASPAPTAPAAAPPRAQRDPIPRTRGPTCKAVADRMASVIGEHMPSEPEGDVHHHAMYQLRCEADQWSDDARSCFATISS